MMETRMVTMVVERVRAKERATHRTNGRQILVRKLAMPLSAAELWLGGVVFKLDSIAQHYKVQRPDHVCWPVLLTKKKGDEALAICPDHANHGDLKAVVHKRPSGFDLDYIYKHFTRGATPEENKKANWTPPNKKSKKP